MTGEKRKNHRQALKYPAKIDIGNGEEPINCLLTDVSASGVRVDVESADTVPQYFALLLASEQAVTRRCKVIWRERNRIGAEFVKAAEFKAAARALAKRGTPAA